MKELNLKTKIPLSSYTTIRIGGIAEWIAEPENICNIKELVLWAKQRKIRCQVIGAGSNLLINDSSIKGLSICTKKVQGLKINSSSGLVEASSGESIPNLARQTAKAGLKGLEWAVGIPGTIGGAVVMNAGAQGNCIADKLESIEVMSIKDGEKFRLRKNELRFSYRNSLLQNESLIVLSAKLNLEPGFDKKELQKITHENMIQRTGTQPYHIPSCGSIFRNPEGLKAGKLIDELGLKGTAIGGAQISKIHANFIINKENATAQDVYQLISLVQAKVKKTYGVLLQPEVKMFDFPTKH